MTCQIELNISGSTKNAYLQPNTINYSDPLEARTNLSFILKVPTSDNYSPVVGNPVYLANASSTMFGGEIDNITEQMLYGSSYVQYNINCVDWTAVCDRRLCNKSYTSSGYDADIICDIESTFLTDEGMTCNNVTTGKTIGELNLNYHTVTQALDEISKRTGRDWYIDPFKDIHYFARTEKIAPMEIGSTSDNWRKASVKRTRDKYKNTEYLQNTYLTKNTTEFFQGDGQTQSFTLTYPVYSAPTIYVNATTKTVGILDVDTGYQWYWKKDSNIITQPTTDTAMASTDYLRVAYYGSYEVTTKTQDDEEITRRKSIEGGSGLYESVDSASRIYGEQTCLESANAEISKYGRMPDYITFETETDGLRSGQLIWVTLTDHGIQDYYYIISVTAKDLDKVRMRYSVKAISGQERGGWATFFKKLSETEVDYDTAYSGKPVLYARKYNANITVYTHPTITQTVIVGYYVDDPACLVGTATVS